MNALIFSLTVIALILPLVAPPWSLMLHAVVYSEL